MGAPRDSWRDSPKLTDVSARAYRVPTDQPEADGTLEWTETTVIVVEARSGDEIGLGWTYASLAAKAVADETLREVVVGSEAFGVPTILEQMVRRCRNFGRPGIVASAISAVDIAVWDLKARLLGCSLTDLFGRFRSTVPVYGSGGFTNYDDGTTTAQLAHWTNELGIPRVKIKIGESWGARSSRDLQRVVLARRVVGDETELYVDANGGYSRKQAIRIGHRLFEEAGVSWFEEPVSADDLAGLREVRDQLPCDVAAGEYGYDESYFARMIAADAVDCVQVDVTRCGGYTVWLRVAALAAANGLEVSAHCAPSLHAAVAAAVPNLRHVEYFHDHERVDALLFDGCPVVQDGELRLDPRVPGHGMTSKASEELRIA